MSLIPTGLEKLDQFLGGGVPNGIITDIFGPPGSGKTHFVMQTAINGICKDGQVLFLDTTAGFRPERMLEMIKTRDLDPKILEYVTVGRLTNTKEQLEMISKINKEKFSLVIIDNFTDLFSFEYSKEYQYLEKNILLMQLMHRLSQKAIQNNIPILVTNTTSYSGESEKENLSKALDIFTHIKIYLSKNNGNRIGKIITPFKKGIFNYKISAKGLW